MYHLPYNANRKAFARWLRTHSILGEVLLWKQLRQAVYKATPSTGKSPWATITWNFIASHCNCNTLKSFVAFSNPPDAPALRT